MWAGWASVTVGLAITGYTSFQGDDRVRLLPGETTLGHHQIETRCEVCHTEAFDDGDSIQAACESCHAAELQVADDSHPRRKFTDPRNADRVAILDARRCVTCHTEHRPEATSAMGLTLPEDYCFACHADIGEERATHEGLGFETCASAGCHNFHDNRGLYEDFLARHADQPEMLPEPEWVAWVSAIEPPAGGFSDAPGEGPHGIAEVDCAQCHGAAEEGQAGWHTAVDVATCGECHEEPAAGFLAGRHGMRLAQDLPPMRPEHARIPMADDAAHRELTCVSCHGAHQFDRQQAAVDACLGCHSDDHSLAYSDSPHAATWAREVAGETESGSGVSCATCHLPRSGSEDRVRVEHNQNANLRPNEKMIRGVCGNCHGIGFSIDSLADPALVEANFRGRPQQHVQSIEMAMSRRRD